MNLEARSPLGQGLRDAAVIKDGCGRKLSATHQWFGSLWWILIGLD